MIYKRVARIISMAIDHELTTTEVESLLEIPKNTILGDIAFPCFTLAKKFKASPNHIALEIAGKMEDEFIDKLDVVGGYLNIFLNQAVIAAIVLQKIIKEKSQYGTKKFNSKNVVIDFSSPNIAKPFSMGHLRSTVIGNALANITEKNGYQAIRINHLGDWGTQFGKLIVAYQKWGDKEEIRESPISELFKIYVKFHQMAELDDSLNSEARAVFKSLEQGDEEALKLWQWFRDISIKEFDHIYRLLGIQFDSYKGEAFYNDKMDKVIEKLQEKNILTLSEGAYVVELSNLPPCLIMKTDGATLYATRDLAAAMYRQHKYNPEKVFYVVGNEQSLHFQQLFQVIQKMDFPWVKSLHHVAFGMMLKDGKKMSTRKGKVVLLMDVLTKAIETARLNIEQKNPNLKDKDLVAQQVGVGAVIFNDLKNYRMNDIEFSIDSMLNFEGETGPYLQYTMVRILSLLEKGGYMEKDDTFHKVDKSAWPIILLLEQYPMLIQKSFDQADPSLVAKYSIQLARAFNKYYAETTILASDIHKQMRLSICYCVSIVLRDSLRLLGISIPNKM